MSTPTSTSSTPPTPLLPHPNLLLAAVAALRDKLIAASVSATPEELAYLASALDKLAGQVGLLDIAEAPTRPARRCARPWTICARAWPRRPMDCAARSWG